MVFIPEVQLYTLLNQILSLIKDDVARYESTPKDSILYQMFGEVVYGDTYNLYNEAVTIFTRKNDEPRQLQVRYFFDISRAKVPTMHITCPAENPGETNGIGFVGSNDINFKQGTWKEVFKASFQPNYQIIITSDNPIEVLVIYTVMKSMIISLFASISLVGLQNPMVSGGELRSDSLPPEIMIKAINLKVFYEMDIPACFYYQVGKGLTFKGIPINEIYNNFETPGGVKSVGS